MSRPAEIEPALARVRTVMQLCDCGRTTATEIIRRCGGKKVPGLDWVVSMRTLRQYIRTIERGETWPSEHNRSLPVGDTGTATSEHRTADEYSARSTSETTAAPQASGRPLQRTGKSRAALRLASRLDAAKRERSGAPSKRSPKHRKSPN